MSDILDRAPAPYFPVPYVQWGPVIAGAVSAAALATVLHAFAAAIGLAVSSTAPTWRDASVALWILSGIYLIVVALASYGLGGYVAGLVRQRSAGGALSDEVELRDNLHGLLTWALATLLTALLVLGAASVGSRVAAPQSSAAPSASVVGENTIAFDIDRLMRGERRPADAGDLAQSRAEVARILLTSSGHTGVAAEDRAYLIRFISARTGVALPDAERRVDAAIESARNNLARARRSSVILAFMAGAAALLGAVAAWCAAAAGGKHRDDTTGGGRWNIFRQHRIGSAYP